jgi:hypothetical protein
LARLLPFPGVDFVAATIVLLAAMLVTAISSLNVACAYNLDGKLPEWIPASWFNAVTYGCEQAYATAYGTEYIFEWLYVLAFVAEATRLFALRLYSIHSPLQQSAQ